MITLAYLIFFTINRLILSSTNCKWNSSTHSLSINSKNSTLEKEFCLKDESCCFYTIQHNYGYTASSCVPSDYANSTKNYNLKNWKEFSKTFCNDFKLISSSKKAKFYVKDCKCGYKEVFSKRNIFYLLILLLSFFFLVFF